MDRVSAERSKQPAAAERENSEASTDVLWPG
jgi:hypothetical protein